MNTSIFTDKLNEVEGIIHTVEEEVVVTNGVYIGTLAHDNINLKTLNVYTGSILTGDSITNYNVSTPSETPWKNTIRIYSSVSPVYISYETTGDTVEAEDINNLQNAIVDTQNNLNLEISRAELSESTINDNLNNEITRSTNADNEINNVININKPIWDDKYTKDEVMQKINDLISGAPGTLDTLNEIATALGNDPSFSTTIINLLGNKVDNVAGKQLSTEDYTTEEKNKLAAINTSQSEPIFETAGGTGNALTLILSTLTNGLSKNFIASVNNGGTATTINNKSLYKPGTTTAPTLIFGKAYTVWYNSTGDCFFIKASAEGDAVASNVLATKKFSNDDNTGIVGTMPNNGALSSALNCGTSYTIPSGYTSGGTVTANSLASQTSGVNLAASYMLVGASGYANGALISGNIPNYNGTWAYAQSILCASGRLHMYPPRGYYDPAGNTGVYYDDGNYISANIVSGKSIFGLAGSASIESLGGHNAASGTFSRLGTNGTVITVNLGFQPTTVIVGNGIKYDLNSNFLGNAGGLKNTNSSSSYDGGVSTTIITSTGFTYPASSAGGTYNYMAIKI